MQLGVMPDCEKYYPIFNESLAYLLYKTGGTPCGHQYFLFILQVLVTDLKVIGAHDCLGRVPGQGQTVFTVRIGAFFGQNYRVYQDL